MAISRRQRVRYLQSYMMLAPFAILFCAFYLAPLVYGLVISFHKWDGVRAPVFLGVRNYSVVFRSRYFSKAFINLAKYVLLTMPIGIVGALCIALLVNRFRGFWANLFRSAYFLPTVIPMFLTASVWRWILTPDYGILNLFLGHLGVRSINWLTDPRYMIPACVLVDVWRSTGFNMIILLAGINGIPVEYLEAAKVDGANTWQQVLYITIPQLEPVLFLVVVNGFISALQIFDIPWLLSNSAYASYGGPLQGMMFPVMDIMGRAFADLKFGEATAYAWVLLAIIMVVTLIQFAWRRRWTD